MTPQQARRAFVLRENTREYRIGQYRHRHTDYLSLALVLAALAVSAAVMLGACFLLWLVAATVFARFGG